MEELFREIKKFCFLCGSNEWIVHLRLDSYIILKCRGCGLGHTFPTPADERYTEINTAIYTIPKRKTIYEAHWKDLINRYNNFLEQIEELQPQPYLKLLDVGCSLGYFLDVARERGFKSYGVEVSKDTSQYAREKLGLNVFCGTLEVAQFPDKTFDVITLWDVIEHVPDPINLLREVRRIMKDDGLIALQSPNMESVIAQMTGE
jgi:2-polyprenyl-3-methyl-5-hydroxy-6-metoxy-1,4-benzoquinol methylase